MQQARRLDPELELFLDARAKFQEWLVAKEELLWRIRYVLPPGDKYRKAAERFIYNSGISHFQSCADDCAERFAAAQPNREFPCFESFIDVFYGDAQLVHTRVPEWAAAFRRTCSPPRKRRRGEPKPRAKQPTLLDRSLLRDAGRTAGDFMRAVRALPHFNPAWERKMVRAGPALVVEDGDLLASEARFRTNFAKAERVLEESVLCAQDWLDIALVLRRRLPASDVTRKVLRFVARFPVDDAGARPCPA